MENTDKKNDMKKTLIICGSAVLVAAIALVCVLTLGNGANSNTSEDAVLIDGEMTFEDFCFEMKEDLPQETMDEVNRLYEEVKQAMKDGDMEKVEKVYTQLAELDVYDYSNVDTFQVTDGAASYSMDAVSNGDWED